MQDKHLLLQIMQTPRKDTPRPRLQITTLVVRSTAPGVWWWKRECGKFKLLVMICVLQECIFMRHRAICPHEHFKCGMTVCAVPIE